MPISNLQNFPHGVVKPASSSKVSSSSLTPDRAVIFNSNPYRNYSYEDGFIDKLGDLFGFRTSQDKVREEMSLNADLFDSQLLTTQREEEYNNEVNSAQRMRQAGLNPDLQGLSGSSQASEFNENENPISFPDDVSSVGNIINGLIGNSSSIITSALGIASGLRDLDSKDIQNADAFINLGRNFLNHYIDSDDLSGDIVPAIRFSDYRGLFRNPRNFQRFQTAVESGLRGLRLRSDVSRYRSDYNRNRKEYLSDESLFAGRNDNELIGSLGVSSEIKPAFSAYLKYNTRLYRLKAENDLWTQEFQQRYNKSYSINQGPEHSATASALSSVNQEKYEAESSVLGIPELRAQSDFHGLSAQKMQNIYNQHQIEMQSKIRKATQDCIDSLSKIAYSDKKGHAWAFSALLLMNFLQSQSGQSIVSSYLKK